MPLVGHLLELSHSSVTDPLLELAPLGISKATGLARLAARHGVDAADVIVFGDAPNDVPMFEWAGTGYAVGNAHEAVKAVASHATESVDDDGVAVIIERLWRRPSPRADGSSPGIGALAARRYCGARQGDPMGSQEYGPPPSGEPIWSGAQPPSARAQPASLRYSPAYPPATRRPIPPSPGVPPSLCRPHGQELDGHRVPRSFARGLVVAWTDLRHPWNQRGQESAARTTSPCPSGARRSASRRVIAIVSMVAIFSFGSGSLFGDQVPYSELAVGDCIQKPAGLGRQARAASRPSTSRECLATSTTGVRSTTWTSSAAPITRATRRSRPTWRTCASPMPRQRTSCPSTWMRSSSPTSCRPPIRGWPST